MTRVESQPYMEQSPNALLARHLQVFREFDASGDGSISYSELGAALQRISGITMPEEVLMRFVSSLDTDGNGEISFSEFQLLAKQLSEPTERHRNKNRVPRLYLAPDQYDVYSTSFRNVSSDEGKVGMAELQELFTKCNMRVTPERLQQIMAEVDDDRNGTLDEVEFMTLIIKAAGMKKRRLGPGVCPLSDLKQEGWSPGEMRKAGYEYKDFVELGYPIEELVEVFSASDLRKAGVSVQELLMVGWDCARAREAGFDIAELASAGCSPQRIRLAGWDDVASASQMRQLHFKAEDMRLGGWSMSELRLAGYSLADLRVAGFPSSALAALHQRMGPVQGRRGTFDIRGQGKAE